MISSKLITKSMLLDLEAMSQENTVFRDRLDALLDALAVPPHGEGRSTWLVEAAGIQPVAAGRWFKGTSPRRNNLKSLAAFIVKHYPVNVTREELLDYLSGKHVKFDVSAELAKCGLSSPEQGLVQTVVTRAMQGKDLNPLDDDNLLLWTKVVIRVARFYALKIGKGKAPDEATIHAAAVAFLDLAILDAI